MIKHYSLGYHEKRVKVLYDLVNYFKSYYTIEPQYLVILAQEKHGLALLVNGLITLLVLKGFLKFCLCNQSAEKCLNFALFSLRNLP